MDLIVHDLDAAFPEFEQLTAAKKDAKARYDGLLSVACDHLMAEPTLQRDGVPLHYVDEKERTYKVVLKKRNKTKTPSFKVIPGIFREFVEEHRRPPLPPQLLVAAPIAEGVAVEEPIDAEAEAEAATGVIPELGETSVVFSGTLDDLVLDFTAFLTSKKTVEEIDEAKVVRVAAGGARGGGRGARGGGRGARVAGVRRPRAEDNPVADDAEAEDAEAEDAEAEDEMAE